MAQLNAIAANPEASHLSRASDSSFTIRIPESVVYVLCQSGRNETRSPRSSLDARSGDLKVYCMNCGFFWDLHCLGSFAVRAVFRSDDNRNRGTGLRGR